MNENNNRQRSWLTFFKNALRDGLQEDECLQLCHKEYKSLMRLAEEQTVVGLVGASLMAHNVKLNQEDVLSLIANIQAIKQQNLLMDLAVVNLCKEFSKENIRYLIVKGQTLAALYQDSQLRQSGDIDFLVHPDDWQKAYKYVKDVKKLIIDDDNSQKHIEWKINGIQYEMHRHLISLASPNNSHYWKELIEHRIWENPWTVRICDYDVPTLHPTFNALYVFVHILGHLYSEGIGLRQFYDWKMLLIKERVNIDVIELEQHLKRMGMCSGYNTMGALLIGKLGLSSDLFPFDLKDKDYKMANTLFENVLKRGNFGHNINKGTHNFVIRSFQHINQIVKQTITFADFAPAEAYWAIPHILKWWTIKIFGMIK